MLYILKNDKPIWIKLNPSINSRNLGIIKPGDVVSLETITNDGWHKIQNGYVYGLDSKGNPLFDSDVSSVINTEIVTKSSEKIRGRYYDGDNVSLPDTNPNNLFPENSITYDENGYKVVVRNLNNGSWIMVRINNQTDERYTYTYTKDGTIEAVKESAEVNGFRDQERIKQDGSKVLINYVEQNGKRYRIELDYDANGNVINQTAVQVDSEGKISAEDTASLIEATGMTTLIENSAGGDISNLTFTDIYGIHGMPYQYMNIVDRGKNDDPTALGRYYADHIVARMPLLVITPGEPEFMAGWGDDDKSNAWRELLTMTKAGSDLSSVSERQGRYYSFKPRWDLFVQYVAPLTQAAAHFLGIQEFPAPVNDRAVITGATQGWNLGTFRWDSFYNSSIHDKLNYRQSAAFYIHSETQISDNFSNDSGKSALEQKVNSFSDMAREVNFFMGTMAGQTNINVGKVVGVENNQSESVLNNAENMSDFTDQVLGKGNFLESIAGNLGAVINGGKLIFPEIWQDSHYIKSYNVTIKLRCPNPDPVSWYFDIWAPLAHLLPLVLPKQAGVNGYISPFLVRAYFKGLFNCQMGIITNMTVSRGEMGNWTLNGLPASVDVNFTIKDLYSVLSITRESLSTDQYTIMKNIGILDYIANICGININEPDLKRLLTMYFYQKRNVFNVVGGRTVNALDTWATNYILSFGWNTFGR